MSPLKNATKGQIVYSRAQ